MSLNCQTMVKIFGDDAREAGCGKEIEGALYLQLRKGTLRRLLEIAASTGPPFEICHETRGLSPQLDFVEVHRQVVMECLKATQRLRAATVLQSKLQYFLRMSTGWGLDTRRRVSHRQSGKGTIPYIRCCSRLAVEAKKRIQFPGFWLKIAGYRRPTPAVFRSGSSSLRLPALGKLIRSAGDTSPDLAAESEPHATGTTPPTNAEPPRRAKET